MIQAMIFGGAIFTSIMLFKNILSDYSMFLTDDNATKISDNSVILTVITSVLWGLYYAFL